MKITEIATIEMSREIELPYYCTDNICHVYKVLSEEKMIGVCYASFMPEIGITSKECVFKNTVPCTLELYTEKFNHVLNILQQ